MVDVPRCSDGAQTEPEYKQLEVVAQIRPVADGLQTNGSENGLSKLCLQQDTQPHFTTPSSLMGSKSYEAA